MKITNIKGIGSNKYKITIDDEKYTVYDSVLIELNLLKPREITEDYFNELIKLNTYYTLYNKMIKFISFKLRTERELKQKLYSLNANKADIDKIISKLQDEGYIDNSKYLDSYINDQILLTLNGPNKIKNKLISEGFNENDINSKLDKINADLWLKKANKLIDKKLSTVKGSKKQRINKIKVYLNNLGYNHIYYDNILSKLDLNDTNSLIKDYQKYYLKLSRKYSDKELEYKLKQKLYSLGYNLEDIDKIKTM